jgi:hypothetical protein
MSSGGNLVVGIRAAEPAVGDDRRRLLAALFLRSPESLRRQLGTVGQEQRQLDEELAQLRDENTSLH